MQKYLAAALLFASSIGSAGGEPRFEVLRLEARSFGDLSSVADQSIRPRTAEEAAILEEINGFYSAGELEYASHYQAGVLRAVARNTGLLDVLSADGRREGCTATAISDSLILTNSHCVPLEGPTRAIRARLALGYETDDVSVLESNQGHTVVLPAIEQNEGLDYAVLRLSDPIPDFVPLRIAGIRDPGSQEPLVIMGFPGARPLSVARRNCRTTVVPVEGAHILHLCRTYEGNSGSLLFSDDWSLVGLHHAGIFDDRTGHWDHNEGILMSAIIADSRILRDLLGGSEAALSLAPAVRGSVQDEATTQLVRNLQAALIRKGCLTGEADGVLGPQTQEAIHRYNQTNQSAINANRLRATDPDAILSDLSQRCESPSAAVNAVCFSFNGRTICE